MRRPALVLLPLVLISTALLVPRAAGAQVGGFVSHATFSADGLASVVFAGGSVAQLESATVAAGASGVWAQDAAGSFALLVAGGPPFLNDGFRARFPAGFATPAAVTLTRASGATGVTPPPAVNQPAPTPTAAPVAGSWTPASAPRGAVPAGGEWIAIAAPEGKTIMARVLRPSGSGPFPAVVLLHSQTGFSNAYIALGQELAQAGFVTVVGCWFAGHYDGTSVADPPPPLALADGIDCPAGPVLRPAVSTLPLEDINALLTATRTLPGVRSDRVGLVGNSRGSLAAILTAASGSALQATVGIGGTPPGGPLLAARLTPPVLLIQGEEDSVVPVVNSMMLEQALLALGRTVVSHYYPQAGHGILFDTPYHADAMSRVTTFLRAQLAK